MRLPPVIYKIVYAVDMFFIAFFLYKFFLENYYPGHLIWVGFFTWNGIQCRKQILREQMSQLKNK